jgi:hypothetical protein
VVELRRKGISSVAAVLIFLATVVAAAVVSMFMYTMTKSATSQAILEVTDAYATGTTVTLTVRNIGSVDLANIQFPGSPPGTCSPSGVTLTSCNVVAGSFAKGSSAVVRCTASAAPRDGDMCTLVLQATNQQTGQTTGLQLSFKVVAP